MSEEELKEWAEHYAVEFPDGEFGKVGKAVLCLFTSREAERALRHYAPQVPDRAPEEPAVYLVDWPGIIKQVEAGEWSRE